MNRFFTLLLAASCLTAVGQVPDYVPTDGLVAWYPFSGNAYNQWSDNLHGEMEGVTPSDDRFGVVGNSFFFDGSGDGVFINHDAVFLSDQQTICLWLQIDEEHFDTASGLGYRMGVLNKTAPGAINTENRYFAVSLSSEEEPSIQPLSFDVHASTGEIYGDRSVASATSPPMAYAQTWYFVCGVFQEDSLFTYVNGDLVSSGSMQSPRIENSAQIKIGLDYNFSEERDFHGHIDDIGFWNRALEAQEILDLYLAPPPVMGCMDPEACNFDDEAVLDDGSCISCDFIATFCGVGTIWDSATQTCIGDGSGDINLDGCVQLNDLLDLLSAYGDCGAEESPWLCGDPLEYQGYGYETVQIGEQCWFAENLRAENYANGDAIAADLSDSEWGGTTEGATAVYGGSPNCSNLYAPDACDSVVSLAEYGRLYNWYSVGDLRGLCPSSWHVPTDEEWTVLVENVGGSGEPGNELKHENGWTEGGGGTNSSGFSALPGGGRYSNGGSNFAGKFGIWWTATPSGTGIWRSRISNDQGFVYRDTDPPVMGFSIRCIKD